MELYSKNLNNIVTSGFYNAMQCTNAPFDYMTLIVCGYYLDGYCLQIAMDVTTGAVRYRAEINNVWSSWDDLTQVDGVTITKDATTKQLSAAVATALAVGVVKPDGESTTVDANGNLSVINRLVITETMPPFSDVYDGQYILYLGDSPILSKGLYECVGDSWLRIGSIFLYADSTPREGSTNPVESGGVYTALAGKVDKVTGKGLSTNDYTTAEKTKLAGLENYDDTALAARVTALETALSNLNALTWGS